MKRKIIVSLLAGLMISNANLDVPYQNGISQNLPVMNVASAKDLSVSTKKLLDKEY